MEALLIFIGIGKGMGEIHFYYPRPDTFPSVSVTGADCALNCGHCGRHFLEGMVPVSEFVPGPRTRGCLVSGGCDKGGSVALPFEKLRQLRDAGLMLNVHTGLLDDATARRLSGLVDTVSIDVVGDRAVVKNVYGIDKGLIDYEGSLRLLKKYRINFTPHVCIGLNRGGYSSEDKAFEMIRKYSEKITLLLLVPTRGTRFADARINEQHALDMIRLARIIFPRVNMGCMRPRIRKIEEELATLHGVVQPSRWAKEAARGAGLKIIEHGVCCACV